MCDAAMWMCDAAMWFGYINGILVGLLTAVLVKKLRARRLARRRY